MTDEARQPFLKTLAFRWGVVIGAGLLVLLIPPPEGVTPASWRLLAVFVATMVGLVAQPLPGGAMVLLGVCTLILTRITPIGLALGGYADPVVWLVLSAFFISRAMIKTGLGRRIALHIVQLIGHTSLGLGYALAFSDGVLGMIIPSNSARNGGIIFPITKSLAETYESTPGPTARRLGSFLMVLLYNTDVVVCAMFLTGQASNALIAGFARDTAGIDLSYQAWATASLLPGLVSLALIPVLFYKLYPPEVRHTPAARDLATRELGVMGPLTRAEKLMMMVFGIVLVLWLTTKFHGIDYAAVALLGVAVLLISGVLEWNDVISEKPAWD